MPQPHLLYDTVQIAAGDHVLMLNSAAEPFVPFALQQLRTGTMTLAEDNVAALKNLSPALLQRTRHVAFHNYLSQQKAATIDIAVMNLLYQPSNAWMYYALQVALFALCPGGRLYVVGAKDRGILSLAKRMQEQFGNIETLSISKGHRVLTSRRNALPRIEQLSGTALHVFAANKLDEGTQFLLTALEVQPTDTVLDLGCGAGFIGLHIAKLAYKGMVTMVDASLAAVAISQEAIEQSGLTNICVLPSDGVQAVSAQRFDLAVTNPPFHLGGIQTTEVAERFIRQAAQVLLPHGRFYLVANRFLKYELILHTCFKCVEEINSTTRYKVLYASDPIVGKK